MANCYETGEECPNCDCDYKCGSINKRDEGGCDLKCCRCEDSKCITVADKVRTLNEVNDILYIETDNTSYANSASDIIESIKADVIHFAKYRKRTADCSTKLNKKKTEEELQTTLEDKIEEIMRVIKCQEGVLKRTIIEGDAANDARDEIRGLQKQIRVYKAIMRDVEDIARIKMEREKEQQTSRRWK